MRVNQELPIPSYSFLSHSVQFWIHFSAFDLQDSITDAQTSKSHFVFPSRYCTAMHSYQVPLFSANPLTEHSFQFNEDNTARWMAPTSWVFLGKGQRKWYLSEPNVFLSALSGLDGKMLHRLYVGLWAQYNLIRDSESHFTTLWLQPVCKSNVWKQAGGFMRWCSVCVCPGDILRKWPPESFLYQVVDHKELHCHLSQ